jgi:hypothetical protein
MRLGNSLGISRMGIKVKRKLLLFKDFVELSLIVAWFMAVAGWGWRACAPEYKPKVRRVWIYKPPRMEAGCYDCRPSVKGGEDVGDGAGVFSQETIEVEGDVGGQKERRIRMGDRAVGGRG